ncbi:MAG: TPM domain-containing protein, partial [Treponema sp.]|nr:TPM domain-containing protein [Treponema sp.]
QQRIVDNADLLSSGQKAALGGRVDSISSKYGFDLVIVTEKNITARSGGIASPMVYADDFFDYNGYGSGADKDGCLFLQVTESRDYWFSTSGRGIKIYNAAAQKKLETEVVKYLAAGNNYGAYNCFLDNWEKFLAIDAKGGHYNAIYEYQVILTLIGWALAFLIGIIVVTSWKSGMNTALAKGQAAAYIVPGSLSFNVQKDTFLYNTVTKTVRQDQAVAAGAGGGGRSHTGSSGRSHGGSGGKY